MTAGYDAVAMPRQSYICSLLHFPVVYVGGLHVALHSEKFKSREGD
jgi:hypothetical protein